VRLSYWGGLVDPQVDQVSDWCVGAANLQDARSEEGEYPEKAFNDEALRGFQDWNAVLCPEGAIRTQPGVSTLGTLPPDKTRPAGAPDRLV
jgi:hypothetical protein